MRKGVKGQDAEKQKSVPKGLVIKNVERIHIFFENVNETKE